MRIAVPSPSGRVDSHGSAAGGKPGSATGRKDSRGGLLEASAGEITAHHPPRTRPRSPVTARTRAPGHPLRLRMYSTYFRICPSASVDHLDRSWKLQMGRLSPLPTTCTSRQLSFWRGRRS